MRHNSKSAIPVLAIDAVAARYGAMLVHEPVSFRLEKQEIGLLYGANGSGKTSLLRVILGIVRYKGAVRVLGTKPPEARPWSLTRHAVRVVPQFPLLPHFLTVHEYVRAWAATSLGGMPERKHRVEMVEKWLHSNADIEPCANIKTLSFGQCRLIDALLACEAKPSLILADEPLAGISPSLIPAITDRVDSFVRNGGAALVIAHEQEAVHWNATWRVEVKAA